MITVLGWIFLVILLFCLFGMLVTGILLVSVDHWPLSIGLTVLLSSLIIYVLFSIILFGKW